MKLVTANLEGRALDYAVSLALGHIPTYNMESHGRIWRGWYEASPKSIINGQPLGYQFLPYYSYDWAEGGPIIDRELINLRPIFFPPPPEGHWAWEAHILGPTNLDGSHEQRADTPLIAAMRCYVTNKLGDHVEIPDKLLT